MPKTVNPFMDFVFGLDDTQYDLLCDCVNQRNDKKLYGFSSYEEAALYYKRKPMCPRCESILYHKDGYTNAGYIRYRCLTCNCSYTLLSDSIFNSAKIPFHKLMSYIELMSFNVPLDLMCEVLDCIFRMNKTGMKLASVPVILFNDATSTVFSAASIS